MSEHGRTDPSFPQELCDAFIDFLWDSKADLQSCALVSRAWLPKSRLHLFHSFKASFLSNDVRRFYESLVNINASPHLRSLLYEITL
ncbi:hypothetical protein K435DRAFT_698252, partial [Dendrothele bispora CBS 962.96]